MKESSEDNKELEEAAKQKDDSNESLQKEVESPSEFVSEHLPEFDDFDTEEERIENLKRLSFKYVFSCKYCTAMYLY